MMTAHLDGVGRVETGTEQIHYTTAGTAKSNVPAHHPHCEAWVAAHPAHSGFFWLPDPLKPPARSHLHPTLAQLEALNRAYPGGLEWMRVTLPPSQFPPGLAPRRAFGLARAAAQRIAKVGGLPLVYCTHFCVEHQWHIHFACPAGLELRSRKVDRRPLFTTPTDFARIANYLCEPHLSPFRAGDALNLETGEITRNKPPIQNRVWWQTLENYLAQTAQDAQQHPRSRLPAQRGPIGFTLDLKASSALIRREQGRARKG